MTTDAVRGQRIRAARTAAGLTRSELAAQVGVSAELIGCLERGQHHGSYALFCRIAAALDFPPDAWIVAPPVLTVAR